MFRAVYVSVKNEGSVLIGGTYLWPRSTKVGDQGWGAAVTDGREGWQKKSFTEQNIIADSSAAKPQNNIFFQTQGKWITAR